MMQEPQEVVEETVTIEEDPGTPTSHVSVVTSDDGTTRRTETKAHCKWGERGGCSIGLRLRDSNPVYVATPPPTSQKSFRIFPFCVFTNKRKG
ncbi:hypothetical protein ATANTOWER_024011 [Ataeniobius toweri]|uniref:Uncharacterized protein n=1 Tax=Ataeniobius toweri TaxID=208326 RepID=A0ABU7ART3_9TELE|nr:hypothetical protein [Ataeniobius toweri]